MARVVVCLAIAGGPPTVHAADPGADTRKSGFEFMAPSTQAMQRDDLQNPAMLNVADGEAVWRRKLGLTGKSCADCHDDAAKSMRGMAARYPAYEPVGARPINLAQRINVCIERHQGATPLRFESPDLLNLEAFVALQSRGMPIAPPADARLAPARERGEKLYRQRLGQLDLACTQCHDDNAGKRLAGSVIPQGHPTAYPIYRLEWQALGSLQRRLRGCLTGIRAEPYPYGSTEMVELELYLKQRAAGMTMESPGVRP